MKPKPNPESPKSPPGKKSNNSNDVQMLLNIQSELYNMGKALSCPLCLSTLRSPVLLTCLHAFCEECIRTYFQKSASSSSSSASSSSSCPVCKIPCSKRAMVRSHHLDDLVKGYKLSLRSFGFAPVIYDDKVDIGMTQIEEEVSFSIDDSTCSNNASFILRDDTEIINGLDEDTANKNSSSNDNDNDNDNDNNNDSSNTKKKGRAPKEKAKGKTDKNQNINTNTKQKEQKKKAPPPTLRQCHEHLEVSRAVQNVLKQAIHENHDKKVNNAANVNATATTATTDCNDDDVNIPHNTHTGDTTISDTISTSGTTSASDIPTHTSILTKSATISATDKIQEMERQIQMKKLNALLKDQEKVVQVGEKALVRAAVYKHKRTSFGKDARDRHSSTGSSASLSASASASTPTLNYQSHPTNVSDIISNTATGSTATNTTTSKKVAVVEAETNPIISPNTKLINRAQEAIFNGDKLLAENLTQIESQAFFSATDDDHTPRPIITTDLNDNNKKNKNSKKIEKIVMSSQEEYDISMDELREKEVADRSMEDELEQLEEDLAGNLDAEADDSDDEKMKSKKKGKDNNMEKEKHKKNQKEKGKRPKTMNKHVPTSQGSDYYSALSQNLKQSSSGSTTGDDDDNKKNNIENSSSNKVIAVGTIVHVQARTWPGVNKSGGTARITKVHSQAGTGVKYDVSFILGGKEKLVDDSFVKLQVGDEHQNQGDMAGAIDDNSPKVKTPERKSRRVSGRKKVERWVEIIDAETKSEHDSEKQTTRPRRSRSSVRSEKVKSPIAPIKERPKRSKSNPDEEEIKPKKVPAKGKTRKRKISSDSDKMDEKTDSSSARSSSKTKRKSQSSAGGLKKKRKANDITNKSDESAGNLTFVELKNLAFRRYESLLLKEDSKTQIINITTSSLCDKDQKLAKTLCTKLSSKEVKIKMMNDFNPKKTTLCITSASDTNEVVSKLRTVKAMRAALAGVPILNPKWISHCIENKCLKSPVEDMYIQTLPTKESHYMKSKKLMNDSIRDSTAYGGVLALGAQHEQAAGNDSITPLLLEGVYVHLCGSGWKKSSAKTKDVHLLVKESGATLLNSASAVTKTLKKGMESGSSIILLCDGPINAISSVFPKNLKDSIESALNGEGVDSSNSVSIVNSTWLFDSISCAEVLSAEHYQPVGSLVKSLWQDCLET